MILSRHKPALCATGSSSTSSYGQTAAQLGSIDSLDQFLARRDFSGATTLLTISPSLSAESDERDLWLAYCAFHLANYRRAADIYEKMLEKKTCPVEVHTHLACCYFMLGMHREALNAVKDGPKDNLRNRITLHCAHKVGDTALRVQCVKALDSSVEDQLSFASLRYMEGNYQEAINVYKEQVMKSREYVALNVYVAQCYYKLTYYETSQDVLNLYIQQFPNSVIALNLRACNTCHMASPRAAESELKSVQEMLSPNVEFAKELLQHNMTVFREGETGLQVFPPLVDVIPESRLNLAIYHLRQDDAAEAYKLLQEREPTTTQERILLAITHALIAQEKNSMDDILAAVKLFQYVGESQKELDTVVGRQCMASCHFLLKQFPVVIQLMDSIKSYMYNNDEFNYNFGQAKTAVCEYNEAIEALRKVRSLKYKAELSYNLCLARCYIMTGKSREAYELSLKMDSMVESAMLLNLIANDCYKMGEFYYAAKAFDVLDRLLPSPQTTDGLRGACIGVFQKVLAKREAKEKLVEVIALLQATENPPDETLGVMKKWAKQQRMAYP